METPQIDWTQYPALEAWSAMASALGIPVRVRTTFQNRIGLSADQRFPLLRTDLECDRIGVNDGFLYLTQVVGPDFTLRMISDPWIVLINGRVVVRMIGAPRCEIALVHGRDVQKVVHYKRLFVFTHNNAGYVIGGRGEKAANENARLLAIFGMAVSAQVARAFGLELSPVVQELAAAIRSPEAQFDFDKGKVTGLELNETTRPALLSLLAHRESLINPKEGQNENA